jgi:regulator of ribonuclease activity A
MSTDSPTTTSMPATADLYDEHGEDLQSCDLQFRRYGAMHTFSGPIVTVRCFEDNVLLKSVLSEPGDGRVLVVDAGGSLHVAVLGDMIAKIALTNGWSGIVVNGAVRDVAILNELPIGIKALGSNPRKSKKLGGGDRDIAVQFGSATFQPGHTLYSDEDGIVTLAGSTTLPT